MTWASFPTRMLQKAYSLDSNLPREGVLWGKLVPAPYVLLEEAGKSGKRNIRSGNYEDNEIQDWVHNLSWVDRFL